MDELRVVQVGMGPLGMMLTSCIALRPSLRLVGAVDTDPALAGRRLGDLCRLPADSAVSGIAVRGSLLDAFGDGKPAAALLATTSELSRTAPQILELVSLGLHVVTTCEELVHPWRTNRLLAARIDEAAKREGVCVLATGVNPGFMMDTLPLTLTAVCQRVDAIRVHRVQDAATRRLPFREKIGAGLTPGEFDARRKEGTLRHVGLSESMHMIAARVGWELDRTEEVLTPVIAARRVVADNVVIERGMAAGVQQIGRGFAGACERVTLTFRASVGEPKPHDTIEIIGEPTLVSRIEGGVNGDLATCAVVLNAVSRIREAPHGLKTMVDIPPVSCCSSSREVTT
jgi:4-hydroxy-tetrahydrodipicolinate reductase